MGTWGTGILEDDEALDIYHPYLSGIENKLSPDQLKKETESGLYHEDEPMLEDNTSSWMGYAKAQLDTGTLDQKVVEVIRTIVTEEIDYDDWMDRSDDDEEMCEERRKVVANFLEELDAYMQKK